MPKVAKLANQKQSQFQLRADQYNGSEIIQQIKRTIQLQIQIRTVQKP